MAANLPAGDGSATSAGAVRLWDWSWRARLAASGADARKWLNGMISANVRDLRGGEAVPAFWLNPKGRVQAMLDVAMLPAAEGDRFLLLTDESLRQPVYDGLKKFIFISKVDWRDQSESHTSLALAGESAAQLLGKAGLPAPEQPGRIMVAPKPGGAAAAGAGSHLDGHLDSHLDSHPGSRPDNQEVDDAVYVLRQMTPGTPVWEILAPVERARELYRQFVRLGALAEGSEQQEQRRVLDGVPRCGVDVSDSDLPQETGSMQAVSFYKGCYVGQEIVERIRARGQVHRLLVRLALDAAVEPGFKIWSGDTEAGQITSVTAAADGVRALGYIRREFLDADLRIAASSSTPNPARGRVIGPVQNVLPEGGAPPAAAPAGGQKA